MWYLVKLLVNDELYVANEVKPQNKSGFRLRVGSLLYTMRGSGYKFHTYMGTGTVLDNCTLKFVLVNENLQIRCVSYNILMSKYVYGDLDFYVLNLTNARFTIPILNWYQWWLLTHMYQICSNNFCDIHVILNITYIDKDLYEVYYNKLDSSDEHSLLCWSHHSNSELQALFAKFKMIQSSLDRKLVSN